MLVFINTVKLLRTGPDAKAIRFRAGSTTWPHYHTYIQNYYNTFCVHKRDKKGSFIQKIASDSLRIRKKYNRAAKSTTLSLLSRCSRHAVIPGIQRRRGELLAVPGPAAYNSYATRQPAARLRQKLRIPRQCKIGLAVIVHALHSTRAARSRSCHSAAGRHRVMTHSADSAEKRRLKRLSLPCTRQGKRPCRQDCPAESDPQRQAPRRSGRE